MRQGINTMRILIVEDEVRLAGLIRQGLIAEGHAVDIVGTGEEALSTTRATSFNAIILDIMLPGIDGLEVCRTLRNRGSAVPILLLTARDSVNDRVRGLDSGADDYLVKPFALAELLARLRAVSRRPAEVHGTVLAWGDLELDPASHTVTRGSLPITLPNKEFRILELLMRRPSQVVTRSMIADHVWDYDFLNSTNVIDVHIRQLRRLIDQPGEPSLVETIRGTGYRLRRPA